MRVILVAALIALFACASAPVRTERTNLSPIVKVADSFYLCDLQNRCATVADVCSNKPVLLALFTTYCVPFVDYIDFLNTLSKRFYGNACVVGVSLDIQPEKMLEPFVEEFGIRFDVYVASQNVRQTGNTEVGRIGEVPQFWVINKNGILVWRGSGMVKKSTIFGKLAHEVKRSKWQ